MARNSGIGTSRKILSFLQLKPTYYVRNWVAKHAPGTGAGKHKSKKNQIKHKHKESEGETD